MLHPEQVITPRKQSTSMLTDEEVSFDVDEDGYLIDSNGSLFVTR